MNKQPQTCYVPEEDGIYVIKHLHGTVTFNSKEIENIYIFTKEELEAQKKEWQREAASNSFTAGERYQCYIKDQFGNSPLNRKQFLDQNYPIE